MGKVRRAAKTPISTRPVPLVTSQRRPVVNSSTHGILILSVRREPVYCAGGARELLAELAGHPFSTWGDSDALPPAVQMVCDRLEQLVRRDWPKRAVHHDAQTADRIMAVGGYGLPDGQFGRFLIILSPKMSTATALHPAPVPACWFTERQQAILAGLVRGQTNKEIAESMFISVHTVKEYVRQLMMKLETTTRTGIVARVAGLSQSTKPEPLRAVEGSPWIQIT